MTPGAAAALQAALRDLAAARRYVCQLLLEDTEVARAAVGALARLERVEQEIESVLVGTARPERTPEEIAPRGEDPS